MIQNTRQAQKNMSRWVKKKLVGHKCLGGSKKLKSYFYLKLPKIESDFENYFYFSEKGFKGF